MPEFVSQAEYARRKDVSRQYINKLVQTGRIPTDEKKRINPDVADEVLRLDADPARKLTEEDDDAGVDLETSPAGDSEMVSFTRIRTAKEGFNAKLAELDYRQKAGQLVRVDEVEKETFETARLVRDRFLALPQEVAGALVNLNDENEIKKFLRLKIRDVLVDVSDELTNSVLGKQNEDVGMGV